MDTSHWLLLELIGISGIPLLVALAVIAFTWRSISRRALFSVLTVFLLWGLFALAYPLAQGVFNPSLAGPATFPSAQFNVFFASDMVVLVFGVPLLLWLRNALRRT